MRILLIPRIPDEILQIGQSLLPAEHSLIVGDPSDGGPALAEKVRLADAIIWGSDTVGYSNGNAIIWGSHAGLTSQTTAWQNLPPDSTGGATAQ